MKRVRLIKLPPDPDNNRARSHNPLFIGETGLVMGQNGKDLLVKFESRIFGATIPPDCLEEIK